MQRWAVAVFRHGGNPLMGRFRSIMPLGVGLVLLAAAFVPISPEAGSAARPPAVSFEVPGVVDPIRTFGEPDIGIDPQGGVFVSGPTGTGTQRSVWFGSIDGGHSYPVISPSPPPTHTPGLLRPH